MLWIRLFFLFFAVYLFVLLVREIGKTPPKGEGSEKKDLQESRKEMVRDPVCGLFLPEEKAVVLKASGKNHYFCSSQCAERFLKEGAAPQGEDGQTGK
ncbi:MAG: hypothetical protein BWY86_00845 [Candidatus Aminicenantes bacterium ADurb.Bin508]|nr:MAG: hypothetical protein BWY86_00845 [Candidatus Aminicenantes bacterium ADurb.Bin508]HNX41984.1 YHS domain-containing protein [Candidatus Aminicenantes bacterium]HPB56466.1 YHS domain-containing protein [Candidatus Aminicenantes bacterium]HPT00025.1 YHS domain-containing protein [Candidatus Aminicenantes bacterium]